MIGGPNAQCVDIPDFFSWCRTRQDKTNPKLSFSMSTLQEQVDAAVQALSASKVKVPQDTQLRLYGLYKTFTVGACDGPKPGLLEFVQRAKWNAWKEAEARGKDNAMAEYLQISASILSEAQAR
jgi:acyl-CoA-binding protein